MSVLINFNPLEDKVGFSQVLTVERNVLIAFSEHLHRQIVSLMPNLLGKDTK